MRLIGLGVVFAAAIAVAAAGCGESDTVAKTGLGPPSERVEFGHISSLERQGDHFVLRFDPAWFLSGETANQAAADDGAVEPGEPVPNDNYVVEEGHRLQSYVVPDDAAVTVLTREGNADQMGATPISVSELARVVEGTSTIELFEPLDTGVWISFTIDTVHSIDQQYRP